MIAIVNESGQSLDLVPGQHLTTEQLAAWLSDDDLPGDFSYPLSAPLNDANRRFVAQSYRPDSARPRYRMPVTVSLGRVLYRRCTMTYTVKGGKLSLALLIDGGEVAAQLKTKKLADLLTTPISLGDGVNLVDPSTPKKSPAACMLDIALKQPGQFPFTFFPIRNEFFWEDALRTYGKVAGFEPRPYVNSWELLTSGQPGFRLDSEAGVGFVAAPQFYLAWVLTQLMSTAGYRIESAWLASPEIQRLTILNMTGIFRPKETLDGVFGGHQIVPGLCLPELSVAEFLKAIKARFGLVYSYNANDRVVHIAQFSRVTQAGPQIDLTGYQSDHYDTAPPADTGYVIEEAIDESDQLNRTAAGQVRSPLQVSLDGRDPKPIRLGVGTTQQLYADSPLSTGNPARGQWLVPTVRIAGNTFDVRFAESERFAKENKRPNGIGLSLLSYYGMQPDTTGALYPFASPDVRNARQEVVGSQALTLTGRNGYWRQYLRAYYHFRNQSIPVSQPLLLPVSLLSRLALHQLVTLTLSRSVTQSFLPVKVQAESPGPSGKAIVRLECQTIPSGIGLSADVDDPLVWLELIQETTRTSFTFELLEEKTKLTINAWADKGRTVPASIGSLPIGVRIKKTYNLDDLQSYTPPEKVQEYVQAYTLVNAVQVIEAGLTTRINRNQLGGIVLEDFKTSVQLDPGEGYYVLL